MAPPSPSSLVRRSLKLSAASILCAVLGFNGCAVGPEYTRPEQPVAAKWNAQLDSQLQASKAANAEWWKSFNDPVLNRLIDLAYKQNLSLEIAGLRIVEARAQLGIVTGNRFPQLQVANGSVTAEGIKADSPANAIFGRNFVTYQAGIDAAWELDFWGKYRRGIESEANRLLATVADFDNALVSLTAEVARTYVLVRTYEELIALAKDNERIQQEGLDIATSRFKNGATSELDVAQATTLLEGTRASIPPLESSLVQARNALSTLLGQPPGTVEALLTGPQTIPQAPGSVAVSVPAEVLRRRPDIRSAELYAAAQCAQIGVAKADLYPSFSLLGSIGFSASSSGPNPRNLFSDQNLIYSAGPRISWPFFNYGRIENGVRVQDARYQQLLVSYRDTVLRAVQEVEDNMSAFFSAQQAVVFEQRSVTSAKRAVELALVQYREGSADYQRVAGCGAVPARAAEQPRAAELLGRDQPDRPLQGARRRLGGPRGTAVRLAADRRRDGEAHQLGRTRFNTARAGEGRDRARGGPALT